ncbi:MAG: uncharacterized protein KVP18_003600 [Porospora cf. gigantea A]|uniref:uncharacterized protein n=1 Tax=Porospora cf. gigantea A TaxID=2853593 RepID=UPI0035595C54|nr:MAG: hypothetical protein KVP18_003600 [Porospora cf. gigantea A]
MPQKDVFLHEGADKRVDDGQLSASIRKKIDKVIESPTMIERSALATFDAFDKNRDGKLSFPEFRACLASIYRTMKLPELDEAEVFRLMEKFDFDEDGVDLSPKEFVKLYQALLLRLREKYCQTARLGLRRQSIITHKIIKKGASINDILDFHTVLGRGSFGEVKLVTNKGDDAKAERVCKIIDKTRMDIPMEQVDMEIKILKEVDHPNILKIFEVYEDRNCLYIITELLAGRELFDMIQEKADGGTNVTEDVAALIIQQILSALAYCHTRNIVHKDLKPANIMFVSPNSWDLKVIDFGVAEIFGAKAESKMAAGTLPFMAPEVFKFKVCLRSDVWSAGVIMYLMLTGVFPFCGDTVDEAREDVTNREPNYDEDCESLSPDAVALLKMMLKKKPSERPKCSALLTHSWFKNAPETTPNTKHLEASLRKLKERSGLKNAFRNVLIHQMNIPGKQMREIIKTFKMLDTDSSGMLDSSELESGLRKMGWSLDQVTDLTKAMDVGLDGKISYSEFAAACFEWRESELQTLWAAFRRVDKDGSGSISPAELLKILHGDEQHLLLESDLQKWVIDDSAIQDAGGCRLQFGRHH